MRLRCAVVLGTICLALTGVSHAVDDGGATVVRQMNDKYQGAWFATARFSQKTTTYDADGKPSVEMWYERIQLPGKLRIDIGSAQGGDAMILVDGQLHTFKAGNEVDNRPLVSLALLLGFDAYMQSPDATVAQLQHEGINTARVHEESWQGRPVFVVGADAGDNRSPQFWVGKDRLLVLRIIQPSRKDPAATSDIRFLDFRDQRRGVIAARIEVYQKDRLVMSEEYSDIETDIPLAAAWFDASRLITPAAAN
jgi:hypothetical protein